MRFHPELERYVQWDVLLMLPVMYLGVVYALKTFMKDREEMKNLKVPMLIYNWTQVAVSGVMTYELLKHMGFPNVFALGSDFTEHAEFWIFVHYLTKILDMFDTVFIVLRKKDRQLSFLHMYHHASIGVVWGWLLLNGYAGGTGYYGAWVNSLVHTVMYFHYGWVALGFNNPFKKFVTTLQISQFYSCMAHAVFVTLWDTEHFPFRICIIQLVYHCTMIALFTGFFKETYKAAKPFVKSIPAEDITKMDTNKKDLTQRSTPMPPIPGFSEE
eukprot:TRINITY_DN50933_c0_g1_i1.p1 TRINITY_DN50933_c0_g1~~TRINITY_DN50933_c0_g1_i1.p1  ORF type:complete len:292 (+),score=135.90 TRINITY_DN50933_c0_g1_i1:65-877(+)